MADDDPPPGEAPAPSGGSPQPDPAVFEAAHERTAALRLEDFDGLVGESFTLHQTLDGYDAGGISAVLTEATELRGEPLDEDSRQPFRIQFELPIEHIFEQRTILLRHEKIGDFWAMLVPLIATETVATMVASFN